MKSIRTDLALYLLAASIGLAPWLTACVPFDGTSCHPGDAHCNPLANLLFMQSVNSSIACVDSYKNEITGNSSVASYWRLDESSSSTAEDSIGALNGSGVNNPTPAQQGPLNEGASWSFRFDGTSQRVFTADVASTLVDNVSLGLWMYPQNPTSGVNQLVFYSGNGSSSGYGIYIGSGGTVTVLNGGVGSGVSTYYPTANVWQYVVFVRDSGTWKFYLDGTELSLTGNPTPNAPVGIVYIGAGNGVEFFQGRLAEVAVWNSVLSQSEIQNHVSIAACN